MHVRRCLTCGTARLSMGLPIGVRLLTVAERSWLVSAALPHPTSRAAASSVDMSMSVIALAARKRRSFLVSVAASIIAKRGPSERFVLTRELKRGMWMVVFSIGSKHRHNIFCIETGIEEAARYQTRMPTAVQ